MVVEFGFCCYLYSSKRPERPIVRTVQV